MIIDQNKLLRQNEGIRKWVDAGGKGTLEWCTSMGKTFASKLIHERMQETNTARTTIVIVPTIQLKNQWLEKIVEFGLVNIKVFVVNTVVFSLDVLHCDLLILDENLSISI